jgi:hypothetical protein
MVYLWVNSLYLSSTHTKKGDDSRRGGINFHALGRYARRGKDVNRFGIGAFENGQPDDANVRYG